MRRTLRRSLVVLPEPRPVLHPLRPLDSATWTIDELPHGRRRVSIVHAPLPHVSPTDLRWWFTHLEGDVEHAGTRVGRYLAWHPLDHVHWALDRPAPSGGAGEGARFRIVEAFGRDPRHLIDVVERVEKLDDTGIRLVQRRCGVRVFQLEHTWSAGVEGTHYVSVMEIGAVHRSWAWPNQYLTRVVMPPARCLAWVRHNIEEVGQLPHLVPALVRDGRP